MQDLGFSGWLGYQSLNNRGQVVGWSASAIDGDFDGGNFFYSAQTGTILIDSLLRDETGWSELLPTAINDRGQIAGMGYFDGRYHGFLMTPIPEPGTLGLLGLGLAGLAFTRRRKQ